MRKNFALVMFDLPMVTKKEHRDYACFVKQLKSDGYSMKKKSIYVKHLRGITATAEERRIRGYVPSGSVFFLTISYRTFCNMITLSGSDFDIDFLCNPIINL